MRWLLLVLVVTSCADPLVVSTGSGEVEMGASVDFPPTALGFSRVRSLTVTNRSRVAKTLTLGTQAPFSTAASIDVPGGAEVNVDVTFTPSTVGAVSGVLRVDGLEVALRAEGVAPLDCGAPGVCGTVRFDAETLACVRTPKADGTACDDALACIEAGSCQSGTCVGRAARCDDANTCTTDSCAVGSGCLHVAVECAPPTNPCQAALCDPLRGCGTAPVMDGTPCGAVSCELANVCLAGQCRAVVPPEGFTCSPASACRGEGVCRNKVCERPPEHTLSPRWTYSASTPDFRFEGVTDEQGNWYWVECSNTYVRMGTPRDANVPKQPDHRCVVTSRTNEGLERFATEVRGPGVTGTNLAGLQLVSGGAFIFADADGALAAVDVTTGSLRWQRALSTPSPHILALADDGHGALWSIVRSDGETEAWSLVRFNAATGQLLGSVERPSRVTGLVTSERGAAFVMRDQPNVILPIDPFPAPVALLERIEADGGVAFSSNLLRASPPVMVVGDRVVMADDAVFDATDGREVEQPSSPEWNTASWKGLSNGTTRVRLAAERAPSAPLPPSIPPPVVALQSVDSRGVRSRPFTMVADVVSDAFLTSQGDSLFVATKLNSLRSPNAADETRVRQVHPLGVELMSCPLVDRLPGATVDTPLILSSTVGTNGRSIAVRASETDCATCDLWSPPRIAVYDLGRPAPGVATRGWVGPRGSPQSGAHPK
ncbi:MAG: hypothetical protein GQE15_20435 [Archangiaceae bacterium]|nr:hypothetical protein [Archangiaceae bacterium]